MHPFTDFISKHIPFDWRPSSGGWVSGNCPMCISMGEARPDTKRRGGFHIEGDEVSYHCFNCGYKAHWNPSKKINKSIKRLLESFGADRAEIQRFLLLQPDDYTFSPKEKKDFKDFLYSWKEIPLPPKSINLFHIENIEPSSKEYEYIKYIFDRNLDFHNDWWYTDYYSNKLNYKNRIILPLRYNKKIVGYTARTIESNAPKYLTTQPNNFVFNLDNQTNSKKIIIVSEGYFDALMTDGVAIGSNQLNEIQAEIVESFNKRIILIPDANKAGQKLALSAIDRGWEVSFPPWGENIIDVGDAVNKYGRLFTIYSIIEFAEKNPVKAKVMAQRWCK